LSSGRVCELSLLAIGFLDRSCRSDQSPNPDKKLSCSGTQSLAGGDEGIDE
jgi:hypothetical protein